MKKHYLATAIAGVALVFGAGVATGCVWQKADTPVEKVSVPTMVQCETEDSVGPCFWDATTQGNGRGYSFYVDGAGVYYFAPEDALDFLNPAEIPAALFQR